MAKAAKKAGKKAKKKRPGKKVAPSAATPEIATAPLTAADIGLNPAMKVQHLAKDGGLDYDPFGP